MNTVTTTTAWAQALAELLQRRFRMESRWLPLVHRLVEATEAGHVCLRLTEEEASHLQQQASKAQWLGMAGHYCPLILDAGCLYLFRHHRDEVIIAQALRARTGSARAWSDETVTWLQRLFPQNRPGEAQHEQYLATACSLLQDFSLISGGPGTGKTSTVIRMLALLQMQTAGLRVLLAAPTGKAAARLNEAMSQGADQLKKAHAALAGLSFEPATTIHRLLGAGRGGYRHGPEHPLACDCLILDEASMIDQYLMARICEALPEKARLWLLGDAQQLAAVEAGSVLADIADLRQGSGYSPDWIRHFCQAGLPAPAEQVQPPLANQVHQLKTSWRFGADSAIGQLAAAVLQGSQPLLKQVLQQFSTEVHHLQPTHLPGWIEQHYRPVVEAPDADTAMTRFSQAQILAVQRQGVLGVETLNQRVSEQLLPRAWSGSRPGDALHALPFMVKQNDRDTGLFNGDVGIFWQENGQLLACVEQEPGTLRRLHPGRLPGWEPAWAMTVHKSQGSEFGHVLLALPDQNDSSLLTRELLYTAVTRARLGCAFIGPEAHVQQALQNRTLRQSGLLQRLLAP